MSQAFAGALTMTTCVNWHCRRQANTLAIWFDAHAVGLCDGKCAGEWQSVLPYDESSGLIAELVGHPASLLMKLNLWRRGLAQERPLEEWLPVCNDMLNDFFLPDVDTEAAMTLIKDQWQAIIAEGLGLNTARPCRFRCYAMSWHNGSIRNALASASSQVRSISVP